ncbi:MAG TPA: hypothetical protein VF503_26975 [Sphingobium sp.]|uniref:hypothetical protein n=1 Tax=Sphingobium sp. TaxID=1912891 RepID=UPI002ED15475
MTNAFQLPEIPGNVPKIDVASPLPGFVTFAHLAARAGITSNHLRVTLRDEGVPKIAPSFRIGTVNMYSEQAADQWFARFQEWRDSAALRAAARKHEQEQRVLRKLEEEQKKYSVQAEVLAAHRQAAEESLAATDARRKAEEETQRRMGLL